jgi:hypothetical protein
VSFFRSEVATLKGKYLFAFKSFVFVAIFYIFELGGLIDLPQLMP